MPTLTLGKHNPRIADIRRAVREGSLTPDGLLPVEGPKLIEEAVKSGLEIPEAYQRRGASPLNLPPGCPVYELDEAAFHKIQGTEASQGAMALVRPRQFNLSDVVQARRGPIVVLAELQDPGNTGTIFRAAESFESSGCIGLRGSASPHNPKVVRASAGSVFRLPHVWNTDFDELIAALSREHIHVVATAPQASQTIMDWNWNEPTAFLIGNEGGGVPPEMLARCEARLRIPQNPNVESLNSAMAASVILYEAWRKNASGGNRGANQ